MSGQTVRYNFPVKIVVLNNRGIGPGMPEIPENPIFNMKPNTRIWRARYDRMVDAPPFAGAGSGRKGFYDEAMTRAEGPEGSFL